METKMFEHQVITQLKNLNKVVYEMKKELDSVKIKIEDFFLSEDDKKAIDAALKEEKKGGLATTAEVFDS